jgi:hypothetical protein
MNRTLKDTPPFEKGISIHQFRADQLNALTGGNFSAESMKVNLRIPSPDGGVVAISGWIGFQPGERRTGGYGPSPSEPKPKKRETKAKKNEMAGLFE